MRRNVFLGACIGALALLAAMPAFGQTFQYSDNFNNCTTAAEGNWYANTLYNPTGMVPPGYRPYCTTDPNWVNGNIPRAYRRDNWGWWPTGSVDNPFAATNQLFHDYGLPWCGVSYQTWSYDNGRVTLNSPWFSYEGERKSAMWFVGDTYLNGVSGDIYPRHWTGTYPMNLQANGMKASFDIVIRTGHQTGEGAYPDGTVVSGDGILFSVQPAGGDLNPWPGSNMGPAQYYSYGAGDSLGAKALPGFSVEFDVYPDANDPGYVSGSAASAQPFDTHNHVGIDVGLNDANKSVATNMDAPFASSIVDMKKCGDNNQPVHVTVFYNDPAHAPGGALGYVTVYMYVDPAKADVAPYMMTYSDVTPNPAPPIYDPATLAFGMENGTPKNGGLGELICQACVGAFPGNSAIFGFLGHERAWGIDSVLQYDNVTVDTYPVQGTACTPTWQPVFNPDPQGRPVTLNASPVAADPTNCTSPGWNVQTYPLFEYISNNLNDLKEAVAYCDANGLAGPVVSGEPNITYTSEGAPANLSGWRLPPGLTPGKWNEYWGLVCNGYIYFPQAGTFSLAINSDDGAQVKIGGQLVLDCPNAIAGTGIDAGFIINLTVPTAGVYPIQLLYQEYGGGDVLEFYRRTGNPLEEYVAIGIVTGGLADQPVIYGQLSGAIPAKDLDGVAAYSSGGIVNATLSPTEKAGEMTDVSGSQVFNIKTIWAPKRWIAAFTGWGWRGEDITARDIFWSWADNGRYSATGWLDVLQNRAVDGTTGAALTTADITYNRSTYAMWGAWYQPLADWEALPAYPGTDYCLDGTVLEWEGSNYAVRFDGYAVLDAGDYWLGVVGGWDNTTLKIGNQVLQTTGGEENPGRLVRLHVTTPGAYPIRVETQHPGNSGFDNWDQIWGDCGGAILYEVTPGHARCPLNSADSRIKVYQNCAATGPFVRTPTGTVIPAATKVAEVGQGGTLGWNGKAAKNGVFVSTYYMAAGTALIEDNLAVVNPAGGGVNGGADAAYVDSLNLWNLFDSPAGNNDFVCCEYYQPNTDGSPVMPRLWETAGFWETYFTGGTVWTAPNTQQTQFAASFTGYIEFPQAGDYAFNISSQDGNMMWIGGKALSYRNWVDRGGGYFDGTPIFVHVDTPGIYDIRIDYFTEWYNAVLLAWEYAPDGSPLVLGGPNSTVKVYANLATGVNPATTAYADPTKVPASAKVAQAGAGGEKGFHMQVVQGMFADPYAANSAWWGEAKGPMYRLEHAQELLAAVLDGVPSINYPSDPAQKVFDGVVGSIHYNYSDWGAMWPGEVHQDFPGLTLPDSIAVRLTGYLDLKKGGHIFSFLNGDGVEFTLGGKTWRSGAWVDAAWQSACYFNIPEDGVYPFKLEYNQVDWWRFLHFIEFVNPGIWPWEHAAGDGWEIVNDANADGTLDNTFTQAFVSLCPVPNFDMDTDGDVDQADFGLFQACFTGDVAAGALAPGCSCFDRGTDGATGVINASDYNAFFNCFSGPSIIITGCP